MEKYAQKSVHKKNCVDNTNKFCRQMCQYVNHIGISIKISVITVIDQPSLIFVCIPRGLISPFLNLSVWPSPASLVQSFVLEIRYLQCLCEQESRLLAPMKALYCFTCFQTLLQKTVFPTDLVNMRIPLLHYLYCVR